MKDFFKKTFTLILFMLAVGLFFTALTATYSTVFINLVLIIMSIFVLLQACGRVDEALHLGTYQINNNDENNQES